MVQKSKKIILTVDDQPVNLATNKMVLQDYFDVRVAKTGKMALYLLSNITVDLLLLDIDMPEMNGIELLQKINTANSKRIPVIIVTSHLSHDYFDQAKSLGANGYVVKPIVPEALLTKINNILGSPLQSGREDGAEGIDGGAEENLDIHQRLKALQNACSTGNCAVVESIVKELKREKRKEFGSAINKAIGEIADLMMLYDYEMILRKIEDLINTPAGN
ncbi:hypothetical protein AGMMS49546_16260 [Spirochaetia bacterium]|nr:hypothetical protein AGMMS49546_16260 [Spirochaetia bacterium]